MCCRPGSYTGRFRTQNERINADVKSSLKATRLEKHLGLSFRATSDIRDHLYFDRRRRELFTFNCALPRQYVLELLDSLHGILLPLSDTKSRRLLQSLVKPLDLDPDILRFEFVSNRNNGEEAVPYYYLTDRITELHAELEGWLERQAERRSGPCDAIIATLMGILFAVFSGMMSFALSAYQAWVTHLASQHLVSPGNE